MEYEMLKRKIQDVLGQSSQLRSDNKALLQFLEEAQVRRRNELHVTEGVIEGGVLEWGWEQTMYYTLRL